MPIAPKPWPDTPSHPPTRMGPMGKHRTAYACSPCPHPLTRMGQWVSITQHMQGYEPSTRECAEQYMAKRAGESPVADARETQPSTHAEEGDSLLSLCVVE